MPTLAADVRNGRHRSPDHPVRRLRHKFSDIGRAASFKDPRQLQRCETCAAQAGVRRHHVTGNIDIRMWLSRVPAPCQTVMLLSPALYGD